MLIDPPTLVPTDLTFVVLQKNIQKPIELKNKELKNLASLSPAQLAGVHATGWGLVLTLSGYGQKSQQIELPGLHEHGGLANSNTTSTEGGLAVDIWITLGCKSVEFTNSLYVQHARQELG